MLLRHRAENYTFPYYYLISLLFNIFSKREIYIFYLAACELATFVSRGSRTGSICVCTKPHAASGLKYRGNVPATSFFNLEIERTPGARAWKLARRNSIVTFGKRSGNGLYHFISVSNGWFSQAGFRLGARLDR